MRPHHPIVAIGPTAAPRPCLPAFAAWLLVAVTAPAPPRGIQEPAPAPADCGRCHDQVHAEWQDSAHARAFTDPWFQQALATRRSPERCQPCHAPVPALPRLGRMPALRAERQADGIDCAACHLHGTEVHGPNGGTTTAHATSMDPTFSTKGSFALCRSCHDLRIADVLPLAREFQARGASAGDESCIGCHMETVQRPPATDPATGAPSGASRAGRSHRLLGPGDAEFCGSAFTFRVEQAGTGRALLVGNAAGHGVPGIARHRQFPIRLTLLDQAGRALGNVEYLLAGANRLLADEERRLPLPSAPAAVVLRVEVDHLYRGRKLATIVDRRLELQ